MSPAVATAAKLPSGGPSPSPVATAAKRWTTYESEYKGIDSIGCRTRTQPQAVLVLDA